MTSPDVPMTPGARNAYVSSAFHLDQVLMAAGVRLPELRSLADGSVVLGTVTSDTVRELIGVLRQGLAKEYGIAAAIQDAVSAAGLKMTEPRLHDRQVNLGSVDLDTAWALAQLLFPGDAVTGPDEAPEKFSNWLIGRLREVTGGGFLNAVFNSTCPRCGGEEEVEFGLISLDQAVIFTDMLAGAASPSSK
ncbi:hypothetical protein ACFV97_25810 [Streptomyces sp. NPDC059913]|uniref:hypothetical protein n=1 Tax=unclassified Streptomyces TaxID=2593676 RepID=UPI00364D9EC0